MIYHYLEADSDKLKIYTLNSTATPKRITWGFLANVLIVSAAQQITTHLAV